VFLRSVLVTTSVASSQTLVTLLREAKLSSETSVVIRTTGHNIPHDGILHPNC
jgi:hypothetical protein